MRKLMLTFAFSSILVAGFVPAAGAAPITIGNPLTGQFEVGSCEESCTVIMTRVGGPGAVVTSPVDGAIVRWRIVQGSPAFKYRLRVVTPLPGSVFTGSGTSAPVSPPSAGLHAFSTSLPIKAGQMIGIDLEANASIGFLGTSADAYAFHVPPLLDGQTATGEALEGAVAFNADIQRPPTISGISPASGSFQGGTPVTIAGSEFSGATAVSFGSVPAQSFAVVSDTQITAVAPALPPGALPVTVATVAGTATSATGFESQACKVPKLKGKKLKRAKKRTRRTLCRFGKVKKIKGATAKTGKVVKQRPKPGSLLAPGAKIRVVLAPKSQPAGKRSKRDNGSGTRPRSSAG